MKNTALITGASSGIGRDLALIHASKGGDLVLVARREKELLELKNECEKRYNVSVKVITKDLALRNSPKEIYDELKRDGVEVDYLINNAGFGGYGKFHERPWDSDEKMIELNILSLTSLTRLFIPDFVTRGSGKVLNVASTAGMLPGPLQAVYYATKAFVRSFSFAISEELSGTGVTITVLSPGPVETEFAKTADALQAKAFKKPLLSSEQVARLGYDGMLEGKLEVVTQFKFLLKWVAPFIPMRLLLKMSRQAMEK